MNNAPGVRDSSFRQTVTVPRGIILYHKAQTQSSRREYLDDALEGCNLKMTPSETEMERCINIIRDHGKTSFSIYSSNRTYLNYL